MEVKLNEMPIEEIVNKSSDIRNYIIENFDGLTIKEVTKILGLTIARLCVDYANIERLHITVDDMVGLVYRQTAQVINDSKKVSNIK